MSWQGLGPVRLGMTVKEAERALATSLSPRDTGFSNDCWFTKRSDGKDAAVLYQVKIGKIVVISVLPSRNSNLPIGITDTRGIGVGATESDIRKAYRDIKIGYAPGFSRESEIEAAQERERLGVKLSEPVPSPQFWLEVDSPNRKRALLFNVQDGKVLWFRTGFRPEVVSSEECR
jgi:hypothetical protein